MYDRKTWVILAICGSLLAVNLYYSSQNQKAAAKDKERQEAIQKAAAPAPDVPKESTAELIVEPTPPPAEKHTVTLSNEDVTFTLSNVGGGIEFAEFTNEFDVGSKTDLVRANRKGRGPIGAQHAAGDDQQRHADGRSADAADRPQLQ